MVDDLGTAHRDQRREVAGARRRGCGSSARRRRTARRRGWPASPSTVVDHVDGVPSASRRSTRCEPRNPAPPTTMTSRARAHGRHAVSAARMRHRPSGRRQLAGSTGRQLPGSTAARDALTLWPCRRRRRRRRRSRSRARGRRHRRRPITTERSPWPRRRRAPSSSTERVTWRRRRSTAPAATTESIDADVGCRRWRRR